MDDEQKALAKRVGAEIRRLRVAAGKTQEDLADEARMTTNYVSLVERGETNVTLAAATRIVRALGVRLSGVLATVGEAAGVGRVTERFRTMVERACVMAAGDGRIRREGEFLWQPQMTTPPLRNRLDLGGASRKLVLIAPEEIALAVERVLEDAFGMSVEELPKSVSRLLGFERLTQEMKDHLDGQVAALAARGRLSISDGEVTLPR